MQAPNDPPALPRQLIVCCDGTNNTITAGRHDTNVVRLLNLLEPGAQNQKLYYDPGVGSADQMPATDSWDRITRKFERLRGLASGGGVYDNIASAYRFLAEQYQDGDQIFLFGFSRGAFTARAVAGMVNAYGLLQPHNMELLATLVAAYFSPVNDAAAPGGKRTRGNVIAYIAEHFCAHPPRQVAVHFVGVFDTVESVGMPGFRRKFTTDGMVSIKAYLHVRQALALDEVRWSFTPRVYWEGDFDYHDADGRHRTLRQRWFRGVHADIGGGYPEAASPGSGKRARRDEQAPRESLLSDQARRWMIDEALACDLRLAPCIEPQHRPGRGTPVLHNEALASPWWGVAGLVARDRSLPRSARERIAGLPPEVTRRHPYDPARAALANAGQPVQRWRPPGGQLFQHLLMFCLLLVCLGAADTYAFAAFNGRFPLLDDRNALLAAGAHFDAWQRNAFPRVEHAMAGVDPGYAAWAILFDIGVIVAYAWFLGWAAIRVFLRLTGLPASPGARDAPAGLVLALGWLPCAIVAADLAEDLATLAVLATSAAHAPLLAYVAALLMALANNVKWCALALAVAALALGLPFLLARPGTAPQPQRNRP
jgi:hypothetical protein